MRILVNNKSLLIVQFQVVLDSISLYHSYCMHLSCCRFDFYVVKIRKYSLILHKFK